MRNPISGTRMIQLSEQEWWLTAAALGPMQVWGVEDAFQGLAQAEASQARQETKDSLAAAGWAVPVGEGLQFHPWLVELAGVCRTAKAVLTVQSARGRLRQQVYLNGKQALLQKPLAPGVLELTMIPNLASLRVLLADDLLEAVIGLPPNLFYGTGIPACILVLRAQQRPGVSGKPEGRAGQVLFINADAEFRAGRAQNFLLPEHVEKITATYEAFRDVPGYARVVSLEELRANDCNLNIRRYADNTP